jgi:hypothetical protein
MKTYVYFGLVGFLLLFAPKSKAQGAIQGLNNPAVADHFPSCGSHHFMKQVKSESNDLLQLSDELLQQIVHIVENQQNSRNYENLLVIPVVFHVVYNNEQENLADSVILNQLQILNEAFRRQNANASQTRPVFLDLVADTKIEFQLADVDPFGAATSGITRTETDITHFGGTLPYAANQTAEIEQWVNDSLYYNWFRLTNTALGGIDPWDTHRYLNVWIGDLRILEPQINNFEELVFIGLATPPIDHPNWPVDILGPLLDYEQGILMHYVAIGDNNPNSFPNPYQNLNSPVKRGKVLVHEVGHYLGLRHIWGDGDCSVDDFISDTPNAANHSSWGCNHNANTCVDDINGVDLPNMVENYMDYSSGTCQNSFTLGQADVMRAVLDIYRPFLAETISTVQTDTWLLNENLIVYPNPFQSQVTLRNIPQDAPYVVYDLTGIRIASGNTTEPRIDLSTLASGTYFLEIEDAGRWRRTKLLKQ